MNTKVKLTALQKKNLQRALNNATDFSVKLPHSQLSGDDVINIGKIMHNRLEKTRILGKGMVIKMSSKQIQDLKKWSKIGKSLPKSSITVQEALDEVRKESLE